MHTIPRASSGSHAGIAAATGGNAEALAKIIAGDAAGMNGFELAALEKELPAIVNATVDERMAKFNIKRDRAEVLGIAALVFATVARQLGIARLVAPGVGVREGVLIELAETAREERAKAEGAHDKALLTAARSFANRVDHDTTHGEHVRQLARALFHQLRDVHGVPDELGVLLEVASLLHDVGEVVNKSGHHKHSEYMIRHGRIPGLDDTAREMVAIMARAHRKEATRAKQLISDAPLGKEQRAHVRRMTAILRVADALDTEHRSRVEQLVCNRMGEAIVLDVIVRDGPSRDDNKLARKSDLFREELGVDLRITVARPVATPVAAAADASGGAVIPITAAVKS
jgi:exopolyphosphatase/guanosine-5'-triphosphate,3'-diphosphate pyrophosphatase